MKTNYISKIFVARIQHKDNTSSVNVAKFHEIPLGMLNVIAFVEN